MYAWRHMGHKELCCGPAVKFKMSEEWGRHMVADRDIGAGECFWAEMALEQLVIVPEKVGLIPGEPDGVYTLAIRDKILKQDQDSLVMSRADWATNTFAKSTHDSTDFLRVLDVNLFSIHLGNGCKQGVAFFSNSSYANGSRYGNTFFVTAVLDGKVFVAFHAYHEIKKGDQIYLNYEVEDCNCVHCQEIGPCHLIGYGTEELTTMMQALNQYHPQGNFEDLIGKPVSP